MTKFLSMAKLALGNVLTTLGNVEMIKTAMGVIFMMFVSIRPTAEDDELDYVFCGSEGASPWNCEILEYDDGPRPGRK
jgi:hypothetical protein